MAGIGKRILGAFVDIEEHNDDAARPASAATPSSAGNASPSGSVNNYIPPPGTAVFEPSDKFRKYFENLFRDSNMPGPDYYEFTKMVEAMNSIPDEKMRYTTAFAGLSIQGLDKKRLLDTAAGYLQILQNDEKNFHATVDSAMQDKVISRKKEIEDKSKRIQDLTREIGEITQRLDLLNREVREQEEKINANSGSYKVELDSLKNKISTDLQKINQYLA